MYSFNSRVRYSELNHQKGSLDCSSIINYFQDCSTFHSQDINRGLSYLQSENRQWILNSWHLQMFYPACLGDNITTGTWAYKFTGFYGYRNFIMKDEAERILAAANSIWVYIDSHTGKPVKIPDDYPVSSGYDLEPEYPMEQVSRKIEMPSEYVQSASLLVVKSNIDSYNHVNNGQYIKLAENYLPDNFTIHSMRAEYRMQAVLGDVIVPLIAADYNRYTVALANEEMKPYAIIEFLR